MQNRLVLLGLTDQKRDVSEQGLINCQRPAAVENVQASHYHIYLFFVSSNHLSLSNQSRTVLIHWDVGIYGFQKNAAVLHDIFFITRTQFVLYFHMTSFKNIYYAYKFNRKISKLVAC